MSELVEFGDWAEVDALIRACTVFKFSDLEEADIFAGSPVFSRALSHLLESYCAGLEDQGRTGPAHRQREWFKLANRPQRWDTIARHAARHPKWNSLSSTDRAEWIASVSAPFQVDNETLAIILSRVVELIDGGDS